MMNKTISLLFITLVFLILTNACMRLRTSDQKFYKSFAKVNLHPQIKYHDYEGVSMRYLLSKTYDPTLPSIVFVHGAPGSSDNFQQYLKDESLNRRANLFSVDRLGYGYSDFGVAYPSIEKQAESLVNLMQAYHHPASKFLWVGWSYGGPIALKVAADCPELVQRLLLLAPAVDPEKERFFALGNLAEWKLTRWMVPAAFKVAQIEKRAHPEELQQLIEDWDKIQIPVTHMHGLKDQLVPYENVDFSKKHLPDSLFTLVRVEKVGHTFPLMQPEMVVNELHFQLDFWEQEN